MQLPRYHRLRHSFYRLEGTRCDACDRNYFPPRARCPGCRRRDLKPVAFAGTGTLYSYAQLRQAPRGFADLGPYAVGMVRLDEGPLVIAQLTDVDGIELHIDMPVQMVTRKLSEGAANGYIVYGYKFRPLLPADAGPGTTTASGAATHPAGGSP